MFDIGFWELFLVAVIGLIVLGPERLPHAVRMAGAWIGRIRRSVLDAQYEITRQLELEELKQRLLKIEQEQDDSSEKKISSKKDNENDETNFHLMEDDLTEKHNAHENSNSLSNDSNSYDSPNNHESPINDVTNERSRTSR